MPGRHGQDPPFSHPADPQRHPLLDRAYTKGGLLQVEEAAMEAEPLLVEQPGQALQALLELVDPPAGGLERQPVAAVLGFVSAGPDAHLDPAAREVING
jgi:hypothetical protein